MKNYRLFVFEGVFEGVLLWFFALQAYLLKNDENKALKPAELQKELNNMLKFNPDFSEAVRFCMRCLSCVEEEAHSSFSLSLFSFFPALPELPEQPEGPGHLPLCPQPPALL